MHFTLETCSQWRAAVFGNTFFIIHIFYINNLEANVDGVISKFEDDTKTAGVMDGDEGNVD